MPPFESSATSTARSRRCCARSACSSRRAAAAASRRTSRSCARCCSTSTSFPRRCITPRRPRCCSRRSARAQHEAAAALDRLDGDHARSHRAVLDLEHDLLALEMMSEAADPQAAASPLRGRSARLHRCLPRAHPHRGGRDPAVGRTRADRGGLGRARRCLHAQPRPAHPSRGRRCVPAAVQADPDDAAFAARPRPGARRVAAVLSERRAGAFLLDVDVRRRRTARHQGRAIARTATRRREGRPRRGPARRRARCRHPIDAAPTTAAARARGRASMPARTPP